MTGIEKFKLALVQRKTIDKARCDNQPFHQGFIYFKHAKHGKALVPFHFYNEKSYKKVLNFVGGLGDNYQGCAFVQHYITYD